MLVNKICPNCGTEQKGLNLKETNGSFVCSKCKRHFVVDGDAKEGYFYGCCPYCKTPLTQGKTERIHIICVRLAAPISKLSLKVNEL